jgi:death on curing protein
MTRYLDLEAALLIAARATGAEPQVADYGLLESALARPRATVMGKDAYPTLHGKAAALLHSLAKNHCLVDGNKRLAWLATVVFCHVNDTYVDALDDDAYDLVTAIADGSLGDLTAIAEQLKKWSRPIP